MKKGTLALLVTALAVLVAVISLTTTVSGDDKEAFVEGNFSYYVSGVGEVIVDTYFPDGSSEVVVPDTVTHEDIEYRVVEMWAVIEEDNVERVVLGKYIRSLSTGVFEGKNIKEIVVSDENNSYANDENGVLYNKSMRTLIRYPVGKTDEIFEIPSDVSSLDSYSLGDALFKKVIMSDGLVRIGYAAFYDCKNLETIESDIGLNYFPMSLAIIGDCAFQGCTSLKVVHFTEKLETIGVSAFEKTALEHVVIPEGLNSIGRRAFANCYSLQNFTNTADYWGNFHVYDGVLYNESDGVELLCYPAGRVAESYELLNDTGSIAYGAFAGCVNLKEVKLNYKMTTISEGAFVECSSLTTIDISNVSLIDSYAFDSCYNLHEIELGKNLYYINDFAFSYSGLKKVYLTGNIAGFGWTVFSDCIQLEEVVVDAKCVAAIPEHMFSGDVNLKTITFEGYDVKLLSHSLDIGNEAVGDAYVVLNVQSGYSVPSDVTNEYTHLTIVGADKGPFPIGNLVVAFFCILLIIGILMFVREV